MCYESSVAWAVCHGQCGMGEQQTHTNNGLTCVCLFYFCCMFRNAGLAFSRGLNVDGYLGLICAIPAIGTLFAPIKFINAGVLKAGVKFKKWAMAVIDGLKHPKLLGKRIPTTTVVCYCCACSFIDATNHSTYLYFNRAWCYTWYCHT